MADAYKALKDVSVPKALYEIGESVTGEKVYETEGRIYKAGEYVLADDIAPNIRERIESGDLDDLLEEADLDEAQAAIAAVAVGVFVPEHSVEHLALVEAGHKVVDRETAIELRSLGAEDYASQAEEAKADGAAERPGLSFEEAPTPGEEDGTVGSRVKDAEDSYVDAETAAALGVEVTPSGVVAGNQYKTEAERAAEAEESSSPRARPTRRRATPPPAEESSE